MHNCLRTNKLAAINTLLPPTDGGHTYVSQKREWGRLDYILLAEPLVATAQSCKVLYDLEACLKHDDHFPVVVQLAWDTQMAAPPKGDRPLDPIKLNDPKLQSVFEQGLDGFQLDDWSVNLNDQYTRTSEFVRTLGQSTFGREAKRVRKPYVRPRTVQLVWARRACRKVLKHVRDTSVLQAVGHLFALASKAADGALKGDMADAVPARPQPVWGGMDGPNSTCTGAGATLL
eukprot:2361697-Pyramimonas_sp.AAC.1